VSIHRSALLVATDEQGDMAELTQAAYQAVITDRGYGDITTQIAPASDFEYFYAEDHHQQYLYKLPNGYRCHANTGLALPVVSSS
jgi:peptide-methionine (S)-S-oxide reductase